MVHAEGKREAESGVCDRGELSQRAAEQVRHLAPVSKRVVPTATREHVAAASHDVNRPVPIRPLLCAPDGADHVGLHGELVPDRGFRLHRFEPAVGREPVDEHALDTVGASALAVGEERLERIWELAELVDIGADHPVLGRGLPPLDLPPLLPHRLTRVGRGPDLVGSDAVLLQDLLGPGDLLGVVL